MSVELTLHVERLYAILLCSEDQQKVFRVVGTLSFPHHAEIHMMNTNRKQGATLSLSGFGFDLGSVPSTPKS